MAAAALAVAASCALAVQPAHAETVEQLTIAYTNALQSYEEALDEQQDNAEEIEAVEQDIRETESSIERTQGELGETAVALYKGTSRSADLIDMVMNADSFSEAVRRYDLYERVQSYCVEHIDALVSEKHSLDDQREQLEEQKNEIASRVERAKQVADEAEKALLDAQHVDGDEYHQVQGNGENCGATSFIVGVNILLHEERYPDNVKVWESKSFNCDSTANIEGKGQAWLKENDLDDEIAIETVKGDVHKASELAALLEDGNVVVISSGQGSTWQRADGTEAPGAFPDGHYIVFYHYDAETDTFYCNDSSVSADKGAGCAYTKKQMQQWLDGRANHFAVALSMK